MDPFGVRRAEIVDGVVTTDVAVIGAGAAGLQVASCLGPDVDVVIVDKAAPTTVSGSSPWAQGGLAAAVTSADSPADHVADTLAASDGLADPLAAWVLAREAPAQVARLVAHGANFDRTSALPDAPLAPALEGGQRHARSVRHGDASGAELIRVLRQMAAVNARRLTGLVERLVTDNTGTVVGAWVVVDDQLVALRASAVVLATGGSGGLFAATTNPIHATGDGLALAAGVGARIRDVEFVQFHPTALAVGEGHRFLVTEALRGAGATLHDRQGRRFMDAVHPDAELAPRHVVAGAMLRLPDATAWLDATAINPQRLAEEFPTVVAGVAAHGFDMATDRIPVSPAAHYHMGGVWTDLDGWTSRLGLLAAGETACTGLHGANRMAGNSLSEALVFGARAAASAHRRVQQAANLHQPETTTPRTSDDGHTANAGSPWQRLVLARWQGAQPPAEVMRALQDQMLIHAGPQRDADGLLRMSQHIDAWLSDFTTEPAASQAVAAVDSDEIRLRHALRAARLIVRSALLRTESRGGHHRTDFPDRSALWEGTHLDVTCPTDDVVCVGVVSPDFDADANPTVR